MSPRVIEGFDDEGGKGLSVAASSQPRDNLADGLDEDFVAEIGDEDPYGLRAAAPQCPGGEIGDVTGAGRGLPNSFPCCEGDEVRLSGLSAREMVERSTPSVLPRSRRLIRAMCRPSAAGHPPAALERFGEPFAGEACRVLQLGLIRVELHMGRVWDDVQLLVRGRYLIECADLEIPQRQVVAFGHYHHRRGAVDAFDEWPDVVLHEEIDGFNGAPVLVKRRVGLLDLHEGRHGLRERPGGRLGVGLRRRVGEVQALAGLLVTKAAVVEDELPKRAILGRSMDAPHVLITVDHRDLADDRLNPRIDGRQDQDMPAE